MRGPGPKWREQGEVITSAVFRFFRDRGRIGRGWCHGGRGWPPILFGAAVGGADGVKSVIDHLRQELQTARQEKIDGYRSLFKIAKFSTVFAYDTVDVYGNIAIVRTHHHVGAAVIENGKEVLDYNREVFVLRKQEGSWKIILYTFNTNPIQGVG
jgi:hypothetical protein